jgi:hypothetical protein
VATAFKDELGIRYEETETSLLLTLVIKNSSALIPEGNTIRSV